MAVRKKVEEKKVKSIQLLKLAKHHLGSPPFLKMTTKLQICHKPHTVH